MEAGSARVPIIIGLVGAFLLMAVAVVMAIVGGSRVTPSRTPIEVTPSPAVTGPGIACAGEPDPALSEHQVLVYFTCEPPPADPRAVVRIHPGVDDVGVRLRFAVDQLLEGPTIDERALGYSSVFGSGAADLLIDVRLDETGLVTLNFTDELRSAGALNSSHNRFLLFGTIGATVFEFAEVAAIELLIEGSCERFAAHFESTCAPRTRESAGFSPG